MEHDKESNQAVNCMLARLFPEGVMTEVAAPWMWGAELAREEERIIHDAVDKRRGEFSAGRTCARGILGRLGFSGELTIGKDGHGAPIWPEGIAGSISHAGGICVVSICRRKPGLESLGVDVEQTTGLDRDLLDLVCDEAEKKTCNHARTVDPLVLAKIVFSAKESVYKCLYPMTKTVLDFRDVHVQLDASERSFTATVDNKICKACAGGVCKGRIILDAGFVYTGCTLHFPDKNTHEAMTLDQRSDS